MIIELGDRKGLKGLLKEGAGRLGIVLGDREIEPFLRYLEGLKEWNRRINLTSIKDDKGIVIRHFLDSLTLVSMVRPFNALLDIGSGAGFPGIPLKIALPSLKVTLLEATGKKVFFMRHVIRTLGLKGIEVVHGRAEDPHMQERLGVFDVVTSRAFGGLNRFLEVVTPYVRQGGLILAMKGPKGVEELKRLKGSGAIVGCGLGSLEFASLQEVRLPFSEATTVILVFKRIVPRGTPTF